MDGFQLTFAKMGKFRIKNNKKILVLIDGKTLTKRDGAISGFEFTQSDFNMDRFSSTTTTQTKTQENSTKQLLKCLFTLHKAALKKAAFIFDFTNCSLKI